MDDNIDLFVSVVDDVYKKSFESQYKGFTVVNGYLVERKDLLVMYQSLVDQFLFIHLVLALTVSHSQYNSVQLSSIITQSDGASDGASDNDVDDDQLSKHQRAILEFFIAKLRLCSQKNMKHWVMVMPLSCHSYGNVSYPPSHPLHGSGCSRHMLWKSLNDIFDRLSSARHDTICQQYTVSMAFDNWQQMVKKTWQTNGCSGNYLQGVASFIKKDKAIMIPTGSVIRSPLGVLFKTTSCLFLDAYLTVVGVELVPNLYLLPSINDKFALEDVGHHEAAQRTVKQEIVHVTTGTLLMPLLGWDVNC